MAKTYAIAVTDIKTIDWKDCTRVVARTGEKVEILDQIDDFVYLACQGWEFEVCTSIENIQKQGEMKMKWIPKKYMNNLVEVYKDSDGWWAVTKKGFKFADMDCHTAHEDTQHELLKVIRTMVACECSECTETVVEETVETVVEEIVVEDQEMDAELVDFKRYNDLLAIVYDTKTTASAEDQQELDSLSYKLKLNGVPDAISELNFVRLQNKMERYNEIVPALEIRIRDIKTNKIESWYCQMFNSHQDYEKEVDKQFDLKNYYKSSHLFEIEHLDLKNFHKETAVMVNVIWYDYAKKETYSKDVTMDQLQWMMRQSHIEIDEIKYHEHVVGTKTVVEGGAV